MSTESTLLHELVLRAAERDAGAAALHDGDVTVRYGDLAAQVRGFASGLAYLGVGRGERVAIFLDKRVETVVASFGAPAHGAVFVPVNPLLKAEQVAYILRDCGVRVLVTTADRLRALERVLGDCPALGHVIVCSATADAPAGAAYAVHRWSELTTAPRTVPSHRVIDTDVVGILYTSGSTGKPKGVVLSHRNMVAGAKSVAACATHPVLSGPAVQRIKESSLSEVIVTNSIPLREEARATGKFKVVSVARLLAEAIRRIHNSDSISSLFV